MSTYDTTVHLPRHCAPPRAKGFDWGFVARPLSLTLLALGVYGAWALVVGPVLIDLIGLWPTRAVGVALIIAILWRR